MTKLVKTRGWTDLAASLGLNQYTGKKGIKTAKIQMKKGIYYIKNRTKVL
jgi:hypothetical protein